MDLDRLLSILRRRAMMLLAGLVVALVAAVLAGYNIVDGKLTSRAAPKFESTARVLVVAPDQSLFATGSQPIVDSDTGSPIEIANGYSPQELAEIYAFFVISDDMRSRVESEVGDLRRGESLSAERRRAGPTEAKSEAPSNSVLPILEITASAPAGRRAVELAETATDAFVSYVTEQQVTKGVLPELRVELQVLDAASRASNRSGSATGTMAIVFVGVFSAFVSLAFARENRQRAAEIASRDDVRWVNLVVPVGDTTGSLPTMIRELQPGESPPVETDPPWDPPRRSWWDPEPSPGDGEPAAGPEPEPSDEQLAQREKRRDVRPVDSAESVERSWSLLQHPEDVELAERAARLLDGWSAEANPRERSEERRDSRGPRARNGAAGDDSPDEPSSGETADEIAPARPPAP